MSEVLDFYGYQVRQTYQSLSRAQRKLYRRKYVSGGLVNGMLLGLATPFLFWGLNQGINQISDKAIEMPLLTILVRFSPVWIANTVVWSTLLAAERSSELTAYDEEPR